MSIKDNGIDVIFHTELGPIIGCRENGLIVFRRLRYAAAPIGELRFALPHPIPRWSQPMDCRAPGVVAPQLPSRLARVMGDYPIEQDEDCLHLDIWAPTDARRGCPVIAFLHGGAFLTGGGSLECYAGATLARRTGAIVVNISYPLSALGFLPLSQIAPANLGIHD